MADVNKLYQEYSSGLMAPERMALYKRGVNAGQIGLPEGVGQLGEPAQRPIAEQPAIQAPQPVQEVAAQQPTLQAKQSVVDEYKAGVWEPEKQESFERGVKAGQITLPEGEAIPAIDEAAAFAKGYGVEGVGELPTIPTWGEVKEQFTGEKRKVASTEAMPNLTLMPEMNSFSIESLKNVLGTMATDPQETAKIIKANSPDVSVRQDEKGNYIIKSAIDGKEYAHKPGFRVSDIPRTVSSMIVYGLGTRGAGGLLTKAGQAAATETAIQASQAALGGEFDVEQVPLAAVTEVGGGLAGKGLASAKGIVKRAPSAAQTAVKEAEKMGVTPLTTDIMPPKTFAGKVGQAVTERIPVVGTGPVRAVQQEQRIGAIRSVLNDFGAVEMNAASDEVMKDLLKKRGDFIAKYSNMKKDVIERLSGTSEAIVPVNKTNQAIDQGVMELAKRRTTESQKAIDLMVEYGDAFQNNNLIAIEELRKELGNKLKSPDLATVRTTAEKQLSKVYTALNEDMGAFIKETGEPRDFAKWKVANKKLSNMMGELKSSTLKSVLQKGDMTPELVQKMIFSQKPSEIKLLMRGLTPDGKKAAKIAVLQRAVEKSGGVENLSTAKFFTNLGKLQKSTGVIFNNADRKVLTGLQEALRLTKRAEIAGVKPATGAELTTFATPSLLSWMLGGSPVAGMAGTAGIAGLARIYESKPVRNILMQLAKKKPGREQELIKQLTNALQVYKQKQGKRAKQISKQIRGL